MKRLSAICLPAFIALFFIFSLHETAAAEKVKKKAVILSTMDFDVKHEVLGLVHYKSSELDLGKIHKELKKQATDMGADYVVGITYVSHAGYLYGSGTAVKLLK